MPNKIPLDVIEKQLPSFVKIIPETYLGTRYNAQFLDTEYNEKFTAIPSSVIKLQHGCKSRSNDLRRKAKGYTGAHHKTPLNQILEQLPTYLELDQTTYKGKREKARFYDKEYKVYFEAYVFNVIREGKGYCKERNATEFRKSVVIPVTEIEKRLFKLYGEKIKIIKESYINTNEIATFINADGTKFNNYVYIVLMDKIYDQRNKTLYWRKMVMQRDKTCQICNNELSLLAHHIFAWNKYPEKRFDLENGITLCTNCHKNFHSKFGRGNNDLEQFIDFLKQKGENLSILADELKNRLN